MKMIRSSAAGEALRRLIKHLQTQPVEAMGVLAHEEPGDGLDAGGYGDPHRDMRPDWLRDSHRGWEPLGKEFWR